MAYCEQQGKPSTCILNWKYLKPLHSLRSNLTILHISQHDCTNLTDLALRIMQVRDNHSCCLKTWCCTTSVVHPYALARPHTNHASPSEDAHYCLLRSVMPSSTVFTCRWTCRFEGSFIHNGLPQIGGLESWYYRTMSLPDSLSFIQRCLKYQN